MSDVTQVRWTGGEKKALEACLVRLQRCAPGRTWTLPDVLRVLVTAYGAGLTPEAMLKAGAAADTLPPEGE